MAFTKVSEFEFVVNLICFFNLLRASCQVDSILFSICRFDMASFHDACLVCKKRLVPRANEFAEFGSLIVKYV